MGNRNYLRGRAKEYQLKSDLEKKGYIVFRTAGSHGLADLIAVKPNREIGTADLWPEIQFIQIKSSIHFKKETVMYVPIEHLMVYWYEFPIKTKEWYAEAKESIRRVHRLKSKGNRKAV
jgi:hypothetical protein